MFYIQLAFVGGVEIFKKIRALLIRVRLELSSQDSIIYFVVKRPYDIILTLNKGKVKKKAYLLFCHIPLLINLILLKSN